MKKKKFKSIPFRNWLDCLAKITIKARDNYTCQIGREGCKGTMEPGSRQCQWCHVRGRKSYNTRWLLENALTGCAHCHAWEHENPVEFGVWFAKNYPERYEEILGWSQWGYGTWREQEFLAEEQYLLGHAILYDVQPETVPEGYRSKFIRKVKEFQGDM